MIGTVIDGSYRVDRLVGEGGFGVVYECTELELNRLVAIKLLRPGPASEREMGRFASEGRNLASLNHPNVVQIYRLGSVEGRPFIVMEFVNGRSLRAMIDADALDVRRGLEVLRQVAAGLKAIHGIGIIHRDLTPNNIVVTDSGAVKILDLGLSKLVSGTQSMDGYLAGTVTYLAPEQVEGRVATLSSDIFSFGIILYETLTGTHPFHAEHAMSFLYNIAHRDPEPLPSRLPDCPPALDGLVAGCLEKQAERRTAGMDEVERCLTEILESPAMKSSTPRRARGSTTPRETPRNPYLNRTMIKRREDFFGRAQEIKRIYARLNATPPGSVSLVGERKIGKSSLLNYIYSTASRRQHLEQVEGTVMIFLDLQQEKNMSIESFVRTLLGIANYELRRRLDVSDCALNLDGVKTMVQRLDSAGFRIAILLDEFEAVTTNPNFNLEFFSFLRFLANHYNVSYITSSARDLQVLCHTKEISDSPFFNIFSTMRLSVFQRAEAEELVRVPSERLGRPLGPHFEQIRDMAGLFPFFIQMACSHAIEYLDEHPQATAPDFEEVRRRFYQEARLHYRYVWDGLDVHERSTILRVSRGKGMPDALQHVLSDLESRHYVEQDGGRAALFSSTFDEFVKTEAERGSKETVLQRWFGGMKKR